MARYAGSLTPPFDFGDFRNAKGHWDHEAHQKAEDEWLEKIKADLRAKNKGDLVGEEVRWQRGDGYARYVITKQRPLTLAHLNVGDAWQAGGETVRGYRLQDAQRDVEADRRWKAAREERKRAFLAFYAGLSVGDTVHYHDGFGEFVRYEVVEAPEDNAGNMHREGWQKGDKVLKPVALVGKWRMSDLGPHNYHVRKVREGEVCRMGNLDNLYETSTRIQNEHADPRKMDPIVIKGQIELFGT